MTRSTNLVRSIRVIALVSLIVVGGASASSAANVTSLARSASPVTSQDDEPASDGVFEWTTAPLSPVVTQSGDEVITPLWTQQRYFTGSFRAFLTGQKFDNSNNGDIRLALTVRNCSPGYDSIRVRLQRVTLFGTVSWSSSWVTWDCDRALAATWQNMSNAGYRFQFSRSGPTEFDENLKELEGNIRYS